MNNKKFDYLVYIGRFQGFTLAHRNNVLQALEKAAKVLILVGSSGDARSIDNPFTYEERKDMISISFGGLVKEGRIIIKPIYDYPYNDRKWVKGVLSQIKSVVGESYTGIIGCDKDLSSYYLKLFPKLGNVKTNIEYDNDVAISATDVRNAFYESLNSYGAQDGKIDLSNKVSLKVYDYIDNFFNSEDSKWIRDEYNFHKDYKEQWSDLIYANPNISVPDYVKNPVFVTGDAVVIQSGHILLVKRKNHPGKGLWALPGGFINGNERIKDGIIRELHEETQLKVSVDVLKRNIKHIHVFDNPKRSKRGRIITHAAYIDLGDYEKLPHVKGSDDAEKAKWVPLNEIKREEMFEDHASIIDFFVSIF